jgi:hypothetical protein
MAGISSAEETGRQPSSALTVAIAASAGGSCSDFSRTDAIAEAGEEAWRVAVPRSGTVVQPAAAISSHATAP